MLLLRPRPALTQRVCAQARDRGFWGFASALILQHLEANALLRRLAAVADDVDAVCLSRWRLVLRRRALAVNTAPLPTCPSVFCAAAHRVTTRDLLSAARRACASSAAPRALCFACVALMCRAECTGPAVWQRLDLSPQRGVAVAATGAVLRGAAARAQGTSSRNERPRNRPDTGSPASSRQRQQQRTRRPFPGSSRGCAERRCGLAKPARVRGRLHLKSPVDNTRPPSGLFSPCQL